MDFQTAYFSARGGRIVNEDSVGHISQDGSYVLTVADGLGGCGGGELASAAVTDAICSGFIKCPELSGQVIGELFETANKRVLSLQTARLKMKSTGVALFSVKGQAVWAHAGDSRLYYFVDGRLSAHTCDHSVSYMAYRTGDIPFSQIRRHEDRSRILRAFGAEEGIRADVSVPVRLDAGFTAFLLCTDGFWENITEDEMEIDLSKARTPEQWLSSMLSRLGGRLSPDSDNYTAAAMFYNNYPN